MLLITKLCIIIRSKQEVCDPFRKLLLIEPPSRFLTYFKTFWIAREEDWSVEKNRGGISEFSRKTRASPGISASCIFLYLSLTGRIQASPIVWIVFYDKSYVHIMNVVFYSI